MYIVFSLYSVSIFIFFNAWSGLHNAFGDDWYGKIGFFGGLAGLSFAASLFLGYKMIGAGYMILTFLLASIFATGLFRALKLNIVTEDNAGKILAWKVIASIPSIVLCSIMALAYFNVVPFLSKLLAVNP